MLLFLLLPLAKNEPVYFYMTVKSECMAQSNVWIALNYFGTPSEPYPNTEDFSASMEKGYRVILFKHTRFPEYMNNESFMNQFPVLEDSEGLIVYGDSSKCKKPEKYEALFMDRIKHKIESGDIECGLFSCRYLK